MHFKVSLLELILCVVLVRATWNSSGYQNSGCSWIDPCRAVYQHKDASGVEHTRQLDFKSAPTRSQLTNTPESVKAEIEESERKLAERERERAERR